MGVKLEVMLKRLKTCVAFIFLIALINSQTINIVLRTCRKYSLIIIYNYTHSDRMHIIQIEFSMYIIPWMNYSTATIITIF